MSNLESIGVKIRDYTNCKERSQIDENFLNLTGFDTSRSKAFDGTNSSLEPSPRETKRGKSHMVKNAHNSMIEPSVESGSFIGVCNHLSKHSPKHGISNFTNIQADAYDMDLEKYSLEETALGSTRLEMRS